MHVLSVILPTYNEAGNLPIMLEQIARGLAGTQFEIIIVDDDSPDETWRVAERLHGTFPQVRVIRRVGHRGLSSAVVEGFLAARGDVLAVLDADGQHDVRLLPKLAAAVRRGAAVAVGSRYVRGGGVGRWGGARLALSRTGTFIAGSLLPVRVSDPLSGYFAVRRAAFVEALPRLRPTGFKILLELLSALPRGAIVEEVPLVFHERLSGASKLSARVQSEFLMQLVRIAVLRLQTALRSAQWAALAAVVLGTLLLTLPRAWRIRALALDPVVRAAVERVLRTSAEREGWLLSSLQLDAIHPDRVRVLRRAHRRGRDARECIELRFTDASAVPCAD